MGSKRRYYERKWRDQLGDWWWDIIDRRAGKPPPKYCNGYTSVADFISTRKLARIMAAALNADNERRKKGRKG